MSDTVERCIRRLARRLPALRWPVLIASALLLAHGCAATTAHVPQQVGGDNNTQQTGGWSTKSPITITPQVNYTAPNTQTATPPPDH